jgi:acid phosphatase family membrane protein YuiD
MKTYAYIIAPILGWVVAQGIKFMLSLRKDGISVYDTVQSGGMPSSHTAFMVSLATAIGFGEGFKYGNICPSCCYNRYCCL